MHEAFTPMLAFPLQESLIIMFRTVSHLSMTLIDAHIFQNAVLLHLLYYPVKSCKVKNTRLIKYSYMKTPVRLRILRKHMISAY